MLSCDIALLKHRKMLVTQVITKLFKLKNKAGSLHGLMCFRVQFYKVLCKPYTIIVAMSYPFAGWCRFSDNTAARPQS